MTIIEAINRTDEQKPNDYTQSDKIAWLSALDALIKREVIDTHINDSETEWHPYHDETPLDTELLAEEPYDDMYVSWLAAKIEFSNREYPNYNQDIVRFNETYTAYSRDYNRKHMPKGTSVRYF